MNTIFNLQSSRSAPVMGHRVTFETTTSPSPTTRPPRDRNRPITHFAINKVNKTTAGVPRVNVLRESRLHQTFQFQSTGGRLKTHHVGFAVYGPSHAHPVFVIGGYGCTRLVGIMFEALAYRYGVQMIWPERPGYGLSEDCNSQDMTALEWADVIIQLAGYLQISKFSIIAQSVGTVFALAIAHKYPTHVLGPIFLISPWVSTQAANTFKWTRRLPAPLVAKTISLALDVMWMFNSNKNSNTNNNNNNNATTPNNSSTNTNTSLPTTYKTDNRNTLVTFEEDQLLASLDEDASDLTTDFPTDRPLRHFVRPKYMSLYLSMNKERMSENYNQGQLCDVMVALEKYHLFGFNYSDVKIPVSAVWGDKDGLIPHRAIDILASSMHDIRIKILEMEGHDLVWKEGVMEWAIRGIAERWRK